MVNIETRFKEIAYKKEKTPLNYKNKIPKSKDVVFFICDELKEDDFKTPFFNSKQIIVLGDGFKFLSYCGKYQNKNLNKNALVISKKLSKDNKIIYRCYLMEKEGFNIRELFLKHSKKPTIKENNYSLDIKDYMERIKESYTKEEIVFIINKSLTEFTKWSLKEV